MSQFYFEYKRVVLVDSADLCYAEIPLDEHAILLGEGNVGKSSILNSLRLFLLPEVNFKNCKNKFAFRSKDTYYSEEESFQHYFPTLRSFLILEIENFTGTHCQILYREKGFQYRRIFVPLAYDQLRPLFWYCCDDEEGIGHAVEGLSSASLIKKIKKIAPDSMIVSDSEKLKKILYANDFLSDNKTRFSLFPLIEQDASKVDSLRALFLLLFDMNANQKAMKKAIANIIEADKKSPNDVLDFNIEGFLAKHEQLNDESKLLTFIKNKNNDFNVLSDKFSEYTTLSDTDKRYLCFLKGLLSRKKQTLFDKKEIDSKIRPLQDDIFKYKKEKGKEERELTGKDAEIQLKKTELDKVTSDFNEAKKIHQQYFLPKTIDVAVGELESEKDKLKIKLSTLQSEIDAELRRKELETSIGSNNKKIKALEDSSKNQQYLLSEQLPEPVLDTLSAINKRLLLANPKRKLKQADVDVITNFTTLFQQIGRSYQWFDIEFDQQSSNIANDLEDQYKQAKEQLAEDQKELNLLQQPSGSLNRQKDIQELEAVLKDIDYKLQCLKKHPIAIANINDFTETLEGLQVDRTNIEAREKIASTHLDNTEKQFSELKPEQDQLEKDLIEIIELENQCKTIEKHFPRLQRKHEGQNFQEIKIVINKDFLNKIDDELLTFDHLRESIIQGLHQFISDKVIEDENNINTDSPSSKRVKSTFNRLQEVYNELPQKQHILDEQTRVHNQSVSQYTQVLKSHAEHAELFEKQLNRDFKNITINDLKEIEVSIEIDRRFRNLVAEISKADLHSDRPLSDRFYDRLKVFVNMFFKDKADTHLTMDKIVTGLHYRIKKEGSSHWQDKKQSNSTTTLINLELVQLLLQRIKKAGCAVTFPLVHDELADININQFDWLLPHLTQQGFNLFSAATHSASTELIHKVKNYHEIGGMRTSKSYSPERTIVYWGGAEKFTDTEQAKITGTLFAEQSSLNL